MSLSKKCPYWELFWSAFSCIRTEYEETIRVSPFSVRIQENAGKMLMRTTPNTNNFYATRAINYQADKQLKQTNLKFQYTGALR